jgi:hypothetical protein
LGLNGLDGKEPAWGRGVGNFFSSLKKPGKGWISLKMPEFDRAGVRAQDYRTADHGTTGPPELSCRDRAQRTHRRG